MMAYTEPGKEIQLLSQIFDGVHGSIYKDVLTESSECVAVKHIPLDVLKRERDCQIQRLKANFDFIANLNHRNLLRQIHHQESQHDRYADNEPRFYEVITEFCEGENLHDFVTTNTITALQLQHTVGQIVAGLEYLHAQRYAHRDFRGANIMICVDAWGAPHIKITGMGWIFDALDRRGEERRERGTLVFVPPERIRGCVVLEIINGGWPEFYQKDGDLLTEDLPVMMFVGHGGVPTVSPLLQAEIQDFLSKCLSRNAKDRWVTKDLMKHDFLHCSPETVSTWVLPRPATQEADIFLYRELQSSI
ncbi:uncharacterized protein LOC129592909 [Paramacrobiotus metropolitanus]|uniref:uncharacterized protein LOC129592909 n=1 Tax=Paramacrobiotus metropolitanus TaxID=2943436 RepID=UPI002445C2F2|nr:uncharacterized protein LOC129592909 [Paramacrobiotus metropolitanus]